MDEYLALADIDASINLMRLSVWNKLSLPELSLICMTLKRADRLISRPVRVTEDVFVKVGTFHFPAEFVVVDFDSDPQVPVILERSFLQTERALIDVFKGELTLRVGKEAITFNLDQSSRYSANYNDMTANQIDVIYMACESIRKKFSISLINTVTNPKEDLKGITTRIGNACKGPMIPTTFSYRPEVVERETKPIVAPVAEPIIASVSASKPNQKPSIPYPSRLYDQKLRDKANDQKEKFFQIFQDLNFYISFADALILMPKFGPTIKSLLTNKDKLFELARTPLNEHCSVVILKKLPKKLGDPGKFLIPCDFPGMDECLALANLDASINLMPLFVWNKLCLPELTPTFMTLELADRSFSRPIGVAEDVFVKVETFHFSADFVVVEFVADPRVPLILRRSFLKTRRALIDVYEGEITLQVGKEAVTFNLDQTSRYSANYNDMMANRIDVINMACEEYYQELLGFSDVIASGNPTPYYDPIVSTSFPTLTPFGDSDFILEEVDAFLALEDDPTSPKDNHSYYETKGDIFLL
nr:reverse transcriptase domain-containing protein [Tanacetum cinerariifolium]